MERSKTKSSLTDKLTNLVRKLRVEIEDLQVEVATHKDNCKILSEDIEKKKQKTKQNDVEMIDDRTRLENLEKIHLNQKQNLKSLSDAELLLRTQLRSKMEDHESTIQRISAVKHRCEGILKDCQIKLEDRLEYYKTLPYVIEHDAKQMVLEDLEREIRSRTKEVEDIKAEIAEICLNNDCEYGTLADWGVAFAKRMLEIRDARKEHEERMKSIKDMTTQVEELRRQKDDIMRQQQIEKENELIAQSKFTRVSSLMDISSLTKSSSKFSEASFESPLNIFDNFFNKTPKPVSVKRKTPKPTENLSTSGWSHGASGIKMTGSLPDLCSIFSSFKSQLTKATTDFTFPDNEDDGDRNQKTQRTLPKIPEFNFIDKPLPALPPLFSEKNEDVQKPDLSNHAVHYPAEDKSSKIIDIPTEAENTIAEAVKDMVVDEQPTPSEESVCNNRVNTNKDIGAESSNIIQQEPLEEQRQDEMTTLPQQALECYAADHQQPGQDGCNAMQEEQPQDEHTSVQQQQVDPTTTTTVQVEKDANSGVQQKHQDEYTTLEQQQCISAQQHQDETEVMQDEDENEQLPLPPPPSQTSMTTSVVEEAMEVDAENVDDFAQQAEQQLQQQQIHQQQFHQIQMETEVGEAEAAENNEKKMNICDVSVDHQYTEGDDHQFIFPSTPDNRKKSPFPSTISTPELPDCVVAYHRMMACGNGRGKTHDDSFDLDGNMLKIDDESAANFASQPDGAKGGGDETSAGIFKPPSPPSANKQIEFAVPSHPDTANKSSGEASNAIFSSLFCNNSQEETCEGVATDGRFNKSSGSGFDFNFKSPDSHTEKGENSDGFSFFFSANDDAEAAQGPSAAGESFKLTNLFTSSAEDENNDDGANNEESFSIFAKMF